MEQQTPTPLNLTSDTVLCLIQNVIENKNKIERTRINPDALLDKDLRLDSFDRLEICVWAEETFNINVDVDDIDTVQDLINQIVK